MDLLARTAAYYRARLRTFGDSPKGMDWNDAASQRLRFERLLMQVDRRRHLLLLDVGCGNGELLVYCQERGLEVTYLGIDICEEMVAACRRRHGEQAAELASTDELDRFGGGYDYVIASGTFNVKQDTPDAEWRGYVLDAVAAMYRACRKGVVLNLMSATAEVRRDHLWYLAPEDAPGLAHHCGATHLVVDREYPLFELTLALHRE